MISKCKNFDSNQPNDGYIGWHRWSKWMHSNGFRQTQCQKCFRWYCHCEMKKHILKECENEYD